MCIITTGTLELQVESNVQSNYSRGWGWGEGGVCSIYIRSKRHFNPNPMKYRLPVTCFLVTRSLWHFCKELGNITTVLCAKCQSNETTETDERDFTRFEFNIRLVSDGYPILHKASGYTVSVMKVINKQPTLHCDQYWYNLPNCCAT